MMGDCLHCGMPEAEHREPLRVRVVGTCDSYQDGDGFADTCEELNDRGSWHDDLAPSGEEP